jgi:hypothetical protein
MLRNLLSAWLAVNEYECFSNFPLGGKFPDIVCVKGSDVTAFSLKTHTSENELPSAVGQCIFFMKDANFSYIVIPGEERDLVSQSVLDILKEHGIGLIAIDSHDAKIICEARRFDRDNAAIVEEMRGRNNGTKAKTDVKESIMHILRAHPEGLTVVSISKLLSLNRLTVSKYIYGLIAEDVIQQRKVGPSKLCFLKTTNSSLSDFIGAGHG